MDIVQVCLLRKKNRLTTSFFQRISTLLQIVCDFRRPIKLIIYILISSNVDDSIRKKQQQKTKFDVSIKQRAMEV